MLELALRGAVAGVTLLMAGLILTSPAPLMRRLLGGLFLWGTANYTLVSGPDQLDFAAPISDVMIFFALFNGVFFWWFALSLFDDAFQWTWFKVAPFIIIAVLHVPGPIWEAAHDTPIEPILHSTLSIALMGHAIWIALHDRRDDLVDPRRRFRLYFAVAVGLTGMIIAIAENFEVFRPLPDGATLVHSFALAGLTFFFAFWLLSANRALFAAEETLPDAELAVRRQQPDRPVPPADMQAFEKLNALMESGVYREEGLSVASLADKVGVPEHQLRRLINHELGFRNFSAFLNARRVADAKAALADPANARKQVLQIALDLGYGSIAPFNRAFKQATGVTPTEFRRKSLNET